MRLLKTAASAVPDQAVVSKITKSSFLAKLLSNVAIRWESTSAIGFGGKTPDESTYKLEKTSNADAFQNT